MNPQTNHRSPNTLANWVNEAPTIEASAQRYDQVVHGAVSTVPSLAPQRTAFTTLQR